MVEGDRVQRAEAAKVVFEGRVAAVPGDDVEGAEALRGLRQGNTTLHMRGAETSARPEQGGNAPHYWA